LCITVTSRNYQIKSFANTAFLSLSSELFRPTSRSLKDPTPESITTVRPCLAHAPGRARTRPRTRDWRCAWPTVRRGSGANLSPSLFFPSLSPPFLFLSPIFSFLLFLLFFSSLLPSSSTARPDRATPPHPWPALLRSAGPPPPSRLLLGPLQRRPSLLPARAAGQLAAARAPHSAPRSHRAGTHAPRRGTSTLHAWPCHARACSTRPSHPSTAAVDAAQRRLPEASRHQRSPRPVPPLTPHSAASPRRRVASARLATARR